MSPEREIKAEMVRKGICLKDLAKQMNLTPATLSRKLSGHTEMKLSEMAKACDILQTTLVELLDRAEQANNHHPKE